MTDDLNGAPLTPGQAEAQKQQQNNETRPDPPFPFGPPPIEHEAPPVAAPPPAPAAPAVVEEDQEPTPGQTAIDATQREEESQDLLSRLTKPRFDPQGYLG